MTLGKRGVKQTKLRGFPLFLGRALPTTRQHFIPPSNERRYYSSSPERLKLFKLHMFLGRTSGNNEFIIANMQRSSLVFTRAAVRTPTEEFTHQLMRNERSRRWLACGV